MSPLAAALFDLVSAPFLIAAGLLVVAGYAKIREPHGAARVVSALGIGLGLPAVRLLGVAEVALGVAAFASGTRWIAVALALAFALFGAIGIWLLVGPADLPSCGCLGALETPPSPLHVLLSVAGAGSAALAAVADPARIDTYLGSLPALGVPFLVAVGAGIAAAVLAMAYVPILASSYVGADRG
ncbi:MAG: MauE/DoxX family redox-associated membrane protein [Gaiellaceae bacterium]